MRIVVSGAPNVGKTTFINDFIKKYPNYRKSTFDYRKLLGDPSTHSKNTTPELQLKIMDGMLEEISSWDKNDNVIMERGPLDNCIFSWWMQANEKEGFDDEFMHTSRIGNALASNMIDLILFIPMIKDKPIPIVDDGTREVDPTWINEIDAMFKAVFMDLEHSGGKSPFFYNGRVPGIAEIYGSRSDRMMMIGNLLDADGQVEGYKEAPIFQATTEQNIMADTLLRDQEEALNIERRQKALAAAEWETLRRRFAEQHHKGHGRKKHR